MKTNRIIHFCIGSLLLFLLTSICSCGLIDTYDGDEGQTEQDRYWLRVKAQLIGTWEIQFMSIENLGYNSPLEVFSETLEGKGYSIVFNEDNTMRYYRDGNPANEGHYIVEDYEIYCYTEDYYDMIIHFDVEDIQSGYLEKAGYDYRNGNSFIANGSITLKKKTINP